MEVNVDALLDDLLSSDDEVISCLSYPLISIKWPNVCIGDEAFVCKRPESGALMPVPGHDGAQSG